LSTRAILGFEVLKLVFIVHYILEIVCGRSDDSGTGVEGLGELIMRGEGRVSTLRFEYQG
jgi:hypothetical protein